MRPRFNRNFLPVLRFDCAYLRASLLGLGLVLSATNLAFAVRPSAMKLFPEETLVFVRMSDARDFGEHFRDTATGRMLRDPQLKPFVDQLYGKVGEVYSERAEDRVKLSWEDLQNLPQGEVAFGIVARPDQLPAFVLLIDQGDEPSVAQQLLDRAMELAAERGGEFSEESFGGIKVTVVRNTERPDRVLGVFERENCIVAATDPDVLRRILWHWDNGSGVSRDAQPNAANEVNRDAQRNADDAEAASASETETENADTDYETSEAKPEEPFDPGRTLAENQRFATILRNCRRPQDPPPHLLFFVDPLGLVRDFGRDSGGVKFAMGLLPSLGVDGILGGGGTLAFSTEQYDSLSHFHLLLENPRAGVLQIPAFNDGSTTPQNWVPLDIETYMTWNLNLQTSVDRVRAIVDRFRFEGAFDKFIAERVSDKLGIDVQKEVIDNLAGRYSWMIGYDQPARMQGQQHIFAAELVDETTATETLKTVMAKYPDLFEERKFGSVTYYAMVPEGLMKLDEEERPVTPSVGIMDGVFFIGGSCQIFERAIASRDGTVDRLVDSADFARTVEVIGRETNGLTPILFNFSRFEASVRHWYDLLTSEKTREKIDENKDGRPMLTALAEALEQNKLPPFEVLAKYLSPGGGIIYDTDSGYHGISFSLRNEAKR